MVVVVVVVVDYRLGWPPYLGEESEPRCDEEVTVGGPRLQVALVEQVDLKPELVQPVEYEQELVSRE